MIGRSAITLAVLLLAANAQASTLAPVPIGAVICAPDPATGERAVIVPPRFETVSRGADILHPRTEVFLVPPVLGDDGSVRTQARLVKRAIPYMVRNLHWQELAEPARVAALSDFAVGMEFAGGGEAPRAYPANWDEHLERYVRRVRHDQVGAAEPLRVMGEPVLAPRVFELSVAADAPAGTPSRVVAQPHHIVLESEEEALAAYQTAAREWASSLPDTLTCDGHAVVSTPTDLGPMPERTFDDIGIRRVTYRREGSVTIHDRTGAEVRL